MKILLKIVLIAGVLLSNLYGIDNVETTEHHVKIIPNNVKYNVPYIAQNDRKSCATISLAMAISYL